jgi:hypothetical protein
MKFISIKAWQGLRTHSQREIGNLNELFLALGKDDSAKGYHDQPYSLRQLTFRANPYPFFPMDQHMFYGRHGYQLCSTPSTVHAAVSQLSRSPQLIINCQGYQLGNPDGLLSLVCVGTTDSPSVYLFDVRSPAMAAETPSMRGFLEMIKMESKTKIMWDCRQDVYHIYNMYGVTLLGVLDLQLVELMARGSVDNETDIQKLTRLNRIWSAKMNINWLEEFHAYKGVRIPYLQLRS